MMQPMAMVKPRNWDTDDGEIEVNDSNKNNSQDPNTSSISESRGGHSKNDKFE